MSAARPIVALKIGRAKYKVRYRRLLPHNLGRLFFTTRSIVVDDSQSDFDRADTLLHEILHAVWDQHKLRARVSEERAVTALATGLTAVFCDNPGLLSHLERLIRDGR